MNPGGASVLLVVGAAMSLAGGNIGGFVIQLFLGASVRCMISSQSFDVLFSIKGQIIYSFAFETIMTLYVDMVEGGLFWNGNFGIPVDVCRHGLRGYFNQCLASFDKLLNVSIA